MTRTRKRPSGCLTVILLLLMVGVGGWLLWERYTGFADVALPDVQTGGMLVVERGDSLPVVVEKLRDLGIDQGQAIEWRLLARQLRADGRLQVGEYALVPGVTPRELLIAMRDGKVIQRRFTLVEGWNIRELRAALARVPLEQKVATMGDAELMSALGKPGLHPEGRFLPETYAFTVSDSDLDVLRRAYSAMEKALAAAWEQRDPDTPLKTPEELLIMASIVEKETGIASERPQIAGLFERRLRIGMRLQTDPTVIYGIGPGYDGNIRRHDLDTDTPYNTYTRDGLPPTPIAMPGVEALKAVAHPAEGDSLYFVAVGDGSGRHVFSRTLAEHNAAVQKYLRRNRENLRSQNGE